MEETKQETTKKQKRLTWVYDEKDSTYTVTIHIQDAGKAIVKLDIVFLDWKEFNEAQQQLILCGIREKTSQVVNQSISGYVKKNDKEIKAGTMAKMPSSEVILDSVLNAIQCFESGKWATDIRGPAEPKVKLSEVKAAMLQEMLTQGIPEDVARSIVAKL